MMDSVSRKRQIKNALRHWRKCSKSRCRKCIGMDCIHWECCGFDNPDHSFCDDCLRVIERSRIILKHKTISGQIVTWRLKGG